MLNPIKLQNYFRLQAHYGSSSILPKDATRIQVQNIKKLSGGMANNVYSFILKFTSMDLEQCINLVIKGYNENASLWFKNYHSNEEIRPYVKEYEVLQALNRVNFPVPKVYLCENDSFFLGYPFLIMEQESIMLQKGFDLDYFATILADLHNLNARNLRIGSLRFPTNSGEFAIERLICLQQFLKETKHSPIFRNDFNNAISWLKSKAEYNNCPSYCLIHGEYHPGHTISVDGFRLKVIDWESVTIGDPAFDVGYAYHTVTLTHSSNSLKTDKSAAETFLSEYSNRFKGNVSDRLEFYKMVSLLGVAVVVSSWMSDPLAVYKRFGKKALARILAFPFLYSHTVRWFRDDFFLSYLQYCHFYIKNTLKN
jgi:aminoglycoside phosphotransferase (APT) family kinase protein